MKRLICPSEMDLITLHLKWDLTLGQLDVTVSIQRFKEKRMILTGWLLSIRQICAFSGPSVTSKHLDFTTIFWPRLLTHILGDK